MRVYSKWFEGECTEKAAEEIHVNHWLTGDVPAIEVSDNEFVRACMAGHITGEHPRKPVTVTTVPRLLVSDPRQ